MNRLGEVIEVTAVRFKRLLPGPPDHVWSYLTECGRLETWFGKDGFIEPREGGAICFMEGHIKGVVTQWQPAKRLAYTWNVFDPGEEVSAHPESYLSFELQPAGEEVELTLFHLPIPAPFQKQTCMGWHTFLDILEAGVSGQTPQPREVYTKANAEKYGVDLNNLAG